MNNLFDEHASHYNQALERGISLSGEPSSYFARGRIAWFKQYVERHARKSPKLLLDFGCGTGSSAQYFFDLLGIECLIGVDSSSASLEIAREAVDPAKASFHLLEHYVPEGVIDLAFSNGVFHHILPSQREDAVRYVFDSLAPGGLFALWENNPWNPGTRLVMNRIPFDKGAETLSAFEAQRLLRTVGFQILRTDFLFIFPRFLLPLRRFEQHLSRLPLGAQYQVLCRRP